MHTLRLKALAQLLNILSGSLVSAVSLANFNPVITDLSLACKAVYEEPIPGCTDSDFQPADSCSQACLNGLSQIDVQVGSDCQNENVDPNSLLGKFIQGQGIQLLCDVSVTTTTEAPTQTTTVAQAPAATPPSPTMAGAPPAAANPAPASQASQPPSAAPQSPHPDSTVLPPADSMTSMQSARASPPNSHASSDSSTRTSASKTALQNQNQNPSKPTCSGSSNSKDGGSPFDAFSDQLCAKSASSAGSLVPLVAGRVMLGVLVGVLVLAVT
jgi:hypothetical protein